MIYYLFHNIYFWHWGQKCPGRIRIRPDPKLSGLLDLYQLVRITAPWIRIRKKYLGIRNTDINFPNGTVSLKIYDFCLEIRLPQSPRDVDH
jgi:hypothetical protein